MTRSDEALVRALVAHSKGQKNYEHCEVSDLGPRFYLQENQGEFQHWLRQYPESIFDVMTIGHGYKMKETVLE